MKRPSNPLPLAAAVFLAIGGMTVFAQNEKAKKDPPKPAKPATAAKKSPPVISDMHLIFEFIEVSQADFNDWLFENPLRIDATDLRTEVQKWSKEKRALIFETVVIPARSGQRAKTESVEEFIYPTEYDPSSIPNEIHDITNLVDAPITAVTPASFETRNVGITIEVDPVLSKDRKAIDLNLSPEIVKRLENNVVWPNDRVDPRFQVSMPRFFTAKITSQISLLPGRYGLVGTMRLPESEKKDQKNPLILLFARADVD